jgi:predicted nucleotidyltransferase component of viral defense system
MLHYQTVDPNILELLKSLMQKDYLKQFVLVGGTALALQIGHRKSVDLDLFTIQDFSTDELLPTLLQDYRLQPDMQMPQTLICSIEDIKVDFIRFKYPFIRPFVEIDGIKMLSVEDIAPMKLDAITGRGSKKDFYDLYYLLQLFDLEQLFALYKEKYPHQTTFHVARSLVYFEDAENNPDPYIFDKKLTWTKVKKAIVKIIQKL